MDYLYPVKIVHGEFINSTNFRVKLTKTSMVLCCEDLSAELYHGGM